MSLTMKDTEKVSLTAAAADATGAPDTTAVIAFAGSDDTVATVSDNHDGTAVVTGRGAGAMTVTATATDVDGHTATSAPFGVVITPGDAASVGITPGTPVAQ